MRIHILGSGGWMPSNNRETSCLLVEHKGKLLMIDAGTGVANLSKYNQILDMYTDIHILLSHYHLDHIIGLTYASKFLGNKNISIYGPKYDESTNVETELNKLFNPNFHSRSLREIGKNVCFFDYGSVPFMIDDIIIDTRELNHSSKTYAFYVDSLFAYVSDTLFLSKIIDETADFKFVFHECWDIENTNAAHSYLSQIIERRQSLCKYYLIHLNPDIPSNVYKEAINELDNVYIGQDCELIVLD